MSHPFGLIPSSLPQCGPTCPGKHRKTSYPEESTTRDRASRGFPVADSGARSCHWSRQRPGACRRLPVAGNRRALRIFHSGECRIKVRSEIVVVGVRDAHPVDRAVPWEISDDIRNRVSVQACRTCPHNRGVGVACRDVGRLSRTEIHNGTGLPPFEDARQHTVTASHQQLARTERQFESSVTFEIVGGVTRTKLPVLITFHRIRVGLRGSQSISRGE